MGLMSEFKEFAAKGSVVDLAVGVIIGGAFGKIVDSLVNDLVMPVISAIIGKVDFNNLYVVLADNPLQLATKEALVKAGIPVFAYGSFLTVLINFIILAFVIFMMVKMINKLRRDKPAEPPAPAEDVLLLREIRDSLRR